MMDPFFLSPEIDAGTDEKQDYILMALAVICHDFQI